MKHQTQQGFGLIEALIAVLVLSIGLLGLATLQAQGLRNNNSAYFRTQASILTSSMLDAMRADLEAARNQEYNITMAASVEVDGGSSIADKKIKWWLEDISRALPGGDGAISCSQDACAVAVHWDDQLSAENGKAAGNMQPLTDFDNDGEYDNAVESNNKVDRRIMVVRTRL